MSTDLAHYISNLAPERQKEILKGNAKPEDLRIGLLVYSSLLPVNYEDLRGLDFWAHPVKQEEKWREMYNNGVQGVPYVYDKVGTFKPQTLRLKLVCGRLKYW